MLIRSLSSLLAVNFLFSLVAVSADIAYDQPRPLMNLASELGERFGLAVNYEDAPFDATSELSSEFHPRNAVTYLIPKWRPITFSVPSDVPTIGEQSQFKQLPVDAVRALSILEQMVGHYNESGNPGRFGVSAEGNYFHIEQNARRIGGQLRPFTPMSRLVTKWTPRSEGCQQLLSDLFAAIGEQYGVRFAEGSVPMGPLLTGKCSVAEGSLTVGQVLERVITGLETDPTTGKVVMDENYAWQLVYEPNWNKYFLNLEAVRLPGPVTVQTDQPKTLAPKTGTKGSPGRVGAYGPVKPQ